MRAAATTPYMDYICVLHGTRVLHSINNEFGLEFVYHAL